MLTLTHVGARLQPTLVLSHKQAQPVRAVRRFVVRADSDDEIVPIIGGKFKKEFTQEEYEKLRNPTLLGGATIGDELALIRKRYLAAEALAQKEVAKQTTANWDGDVYIGSNWNELSVLYLIFMLTPLLGLAFAWATHGTLWDTGVYY
ncbi:hypothetical protein C2E20_2033 [Micractinium conductrix]|uniref:Uncharacterized protein n=1 Tax=Micractinium conductrix TaxID=554055 RepID=A0A2P6VL81_9CHLO|nr:hypothetical protein C2E20_2033 [Micractinium conductrix]|eukprot:PSC74862.1 hypothetical protein C2E20_2033 [Micractinium conductrix]